MSAPDARVRRPPGMTRDLSGVAVFAAAVLALAFALTSGVWLNALTMTLYAALLAQAWNVLGGYGGQFSFGNALFFGVGAYASAWLQLALGVNAWAALGLAVLAAAAAAALTGAIAFRYGLRGSTFALVTLAFAEVARIGALSAGFTGGGVGLMLPLQTSAANLQFASRRGFACVLLAIVVAALVLTAWLRHSRYGAQLQAVRDNEDAARAVGVDPFRCKLVAAVLAGALTGAAGVLYLQLFQYIDPAIAFGPQVSVEALVGAIVGGLGTLWGPVAGALLLHALAEATRGLFGTLPGVSLVIYGALLVATVTFAPRGLAGWRRRG